MTHALVLLLALLIGVVAGLRAFTAPAVVAWAALLQDTDCCVAPVLSLGEAARHPHNSVRGTFVDVAGVSQPAPAPRFSRTPSQAGQVAAQATAGAEVLARWTREPAARSGT